MSLTTPHNHACHGIRRATVGYLMNPRGPCWTTLAATVRYPPAKGPLLAPIDPQTHFSLAIWRLFPTVPTYYCYPISPSSTLRIRLLRKSLRPSINATLIGGRTSYCINDPRTPWYLCKQPKSHISLCYAPLLPTTAPQRPDPWLASPLHLPLL